MFDLRRTRWKRLAKLSTAARNKCKITDREYHLILPSFLPIYPIKATRPLVSRALISFVFTVETRHRSKMFLAPFEGLGRRRIKGKLSPFTISPSGTPADFPPEDVAQLFAYLRNGAEIARATAIRRWVTSPRLVYRRTVKARGSLRRITWRRRVSWNVLPYARKKGSPWTKHHRPEGAKRSRKHRVLARLSFYTSPAKTRIWRRCNSVICRKKNWQIVSCVNH